MGNPPNAVTKFNTGSNDFEIYITQIEHETQVQTGQRKEIINGVVTEIDAELVCFPLMETLGEYNRIYFKRVR